VWQWFLSNLLPSPTNKDLPALQSFLFVAPEAGDLIRGGAGLRKLRWSAQGRGKRWRESNLQLAYFEALHLPDLWLRKERARRLDAAADQGTRKVDEGYERWISSISIN
jgi:hypothetical protein